VKRGRHSKEKKGRGIDFIVQIDAKERKRINITCETQTQKGGKKKDPQKQTNISRWDGRFNEKMGHPGN